MKTIITTYPDFQNLPVGVKRMLVASEDFFFREIQSSAAAKARSVGGNRAREAAMRRKRLEAEGTFSAFGEGWRN